MTTPSTDPPSRPRVLVLVPARRKDDLEAVLHTIESQVYEPQGVMVVADRPPQAAGEGPQPRRVRTISEALAEAGETIDYLWFLDPRTTARPDALQHLVSTAERVDASVVGSKILDAANPEQMLSVGGATDVFGFPYTVVDRGEIDQGQFDVIRDVAYVEPASMLVRRDLAEGLGGLDYELPYLASGLDLCQRARVVGGRIVVAPLSEVFSPDPGEGRVHTWREQAGRLRVMLKTYSPVTLLWAVPGLLLLGLLTGLYRAARGEVSAPIDWARTWLWNILHLPSTLMARRRAPAASTASDAELFRFQVRGSVELRGVVSRLGGFLTSEADPEAGDDSPAFWQRPSAMTTLLGLGFLALVTRSIVVDGLPATGFALPLPDSAWNTLRAYAGGWHLGGLGSPEPMHPSVGVTALVQLVLGNRAGLAAALLTVGAAASGLAGSFALVRRAGIRRGPSLVAGAVFVAGFPMWALAAEGYWPGLAAMGGLPWAVAGVVAPAPDGLAGWIRRLARIGLATMWSAAFVPPLILAPILFGVIWAVVARAYRALWAAPVASVLAAPVLAPWVADPDLETLVAAGVPFHFEPAWWTAVPLLAAAAAVVLSARGRPMTVAAAGLLTGAAGFAVSRAATLGVGREITVSGALVLALGVSLVVAGALDGPATLEGARLIRRWTVYTAAAAAAFVGLTALVIVPSGRLGLPEDRFGVLAFTEGRAGEHGADRLLMIGPGETLPGEYRRLPGGAAYRVVGGSADYSQAWLPRPLAGDDALESALVGLLSGEELRPGARLAGYGIRWVVMTGETPLSGAMSAQLDLRPLSGLFVGESGGVWESEAAAYRAVTDAGVPWSWVGPDYVGMSFGTSVRIGENADRRWGPGEWNAAGWANQVSAAEGLAVFEGVPSYRRMAWAAAGAALLLLVLAVAPLPFRRGADPA